MDSIFSHASPDPSASGRDKMPSPKTACVDVPREPDEAFAGFTDGIHLWWPVEQTRFGEDTHPEFTDGELFEEDGSGQSAHWATVLSSSASRQIVLSWYLDGNPNHSSRVSISFTPLGSGTRVDVQHDGWASGTLGLEQSAAAPDWAATLARFRRFMGGQA